MRIEAEREKIGNQLSNKSVRILTTNYCEQYKVQK